MRNTFLLSAVAYFLAEFVFGGIPLKQKIWATGTHLAVVGVITVVLLGQLVAPLLAWILACHLLVDLIPSGQPGKWWNPLRSFLVTQFLHLGLIMLGATIFDQTAATGFWLTILNSRQIEIYLRLALLAGGLVVLVNWGGILIERIFQCLHVPEPVSGGPERVIGGGEVLDDPPISVTGDVNASVKRQDGIPNGGRIIGWLERLIVFLLLAISQPAGIGFLLAAKSILRFGDIKDAHQRMLTESIIIGTFLSFGWAIFVSTVLLKVLG